MGLAHNEPQSINPEMVILARESRGFSQQALADYLGIAQGTVSKIEMGLLDMADEPLDRLASVLDYPPHFFRQQGRRMGMPMQEIFHRKRQDVPKKTLEKIYAQIDIRTKHVEALLQAFDIPCDARPLNVDEYEGCVEDIARMVRAMWNLPRGPIPNLTEAVENVGVIVVPFDFETRRIDAMSRWVPPVPPLFFVNSESPMDRCRFTLAHELGHIVMHRDPNPELEEQADRFAAEFLMPERDIRADLTSLTFSKLPQLKRYWKVSMAALLKRALDIGAITKNQSTYLWRQLAAAGYRTHEPAELDIPFEQPILMRELTEKHLQELGYSREDLKWILRLNDNEFHAFYLGAATSNRQRFQLVKSVPQAEINYF